MCVVLSLAEFPIDENFKKNEEKTDAGSGECISDSGHTGCAKVLRAELSSSSELHTVHTQNLVGKPAIRIKREIYDAILRV